MTHEQILERAIQKAVDGGWSDVLLDSWEWNPWTKKLVEETYEQFDSRPVYAFIFNHDFAKALWGEADKFTDKELQELYHATHIDEVMWPTWKYHLQQMVIADEPIKYLGEHL